MDLDSFCLWQGGSFGVVFEATVLELKTFDPKQFLPRAVWTKLHATPVPKLAKSRTANQNFVFTSSFYLLFLILSSSRNFRGIITKQKRYPFPKRILVFSFSELLQN